MQRRPPGQTACNGCEGKGGTRLGGVGLWNSTWVFPLSHSCTFLTNSPDTHAVSTRRATCNMPQGVCKRMCVSLCVIKSLNSYAPQAALLLWKSFGFVSFGLTVAPPPLPSPLIRSDASQRLSLIIRFPFSLKSHILTQRRECIIQGGWGKCFWGIF